MQLGIFAKTFPRPTLEEVFQAVASHGLAVVQFNFACAGLPSLPDEIEPVVLDRIRRATTRHQVSIAAVSGTFNMIHPDARQRRDGLRRLGVVAAACERLGASVLTLCTGTRDLENMWWAHPDNSAPESWQDLTASMAEALAIAETHQLILGIEPELNNVVDSARQARRLLDDMKSPRLKIILDPANLFHPGNPASWPPTLEDAFASLGGDIILAHAKELDGEGHAGNLALGAGRLDWDDYLTRLDGAGFAGPLIMHGFEESDVPASTAFLKQKLGKLLISRERKHPLHPEVVGGRGGPQAASPSPRPLRSRASAASRMGRGEVLESDSPPLPVPLLPPREEREKPPTASGFTGKPPPA